ncbi:hypothetical protein XENTR_v10020895 [Xenopus tropicalis]|nr:hypothetical protein XENTR_v10020895 [Xenopus tropicalis]
MSSKLLTLEKLCGLVLWSRKTWVPILDSGECVLSKNIWLSGVSVLFCSIIPHKGCKCVDFAGAEMIDHMGVCSHWGPYMPHT